ncbi:hypothetical protein FNF31_06446 [Cafeteria roenbergensis]|uniref:EGF-like domain-containing protein n=2 Tax=Cafeteria roenbergensis TaxID=33653 RepID=A0A5A8CK96_CAFRO|nr:hypothetical protein FNF31_06446 [Cafeteria roenbergensis]
MTAASVRWAAAAACLALAAAYREVHEGALLTPAIFEPYHPGFVGRYGEASNPRRFRVNPGGPLTATQPNVFAGVAPRQVCPGMTPELADGAHYCTSERAGLCDRRSGTCFCFEGYEGEACERCRPTHFRDNATAPCLPRVLCPLACSGAGTCDFHTGECKCAPHREGPGCELARCPGLDAHCSECDTERCRACAEGYALTATGRCAPCWLIDPRCLACTAEGRCTMCADPLLNSVRRSGRRARDLPLPLDEVVRELSHGLPFTSASHLYFEEAEPVYDMAERLRAHEAARRLAARRAVHAIGRNLTLQPGAVAGAAELEAADGGGLGWGDALLMGGAFPSPEELGLAPGFVGGMSGTGAVDPSASGPAGAGEGTVLPGPHSAAAARLLGAGYTPSWPGWRRGMWPLYEAATPAAGADAYTRLALRGQAGNGSALAPGRADEFLASLANVTGMGASAGASAGAEPDGRSGWFAAGDSSSPAERDLVGASSLVQLPEPGQYTRLYNDSYNRTWELWRPHAWYEARNATLLRDEALACDRGTGLDRRWRCHRFPVSHSVCGSPGTLSWASPRWAVREDEGRLRVAVRRSGGGMGRVEARWWLVHNSTGAADLSAGAQYEAGGASAGGGARELVFEEGVVQLSFDLTIHDDDAVEGNETAWLVLELGGRAGGASVGPQRVATVVIIDDDADRAAASHSMLSSPSAVLGLAVHPAARLAGAPAAGELAAVAGMPLPVVIHARAPPFGASLLRATDTTLAGVQGPAIAELDAAARRAAANASAGASPWPASALLASAEPRLPVPNAGHFAPGAYAGEQPGELRFALEVWPARGGGGLGMGAARTSAGGASGLRVPPSAAGYAASQAGIDSSEAAALADARADPGAAGGGSLRWRDAYGLGDLDGARRLAGAARTGEAGAWLWEEGEASAAGGGGPGMGWGRSGVRRRASMQTRASQPFNATQWPAEAQAAVLAAGGLGAVELPWAAGAGAAAANSAESANGNPWEPAGGWEGEASVLAARPWPFRFGAGYGQGRLRGAPVARGEVLWAGALSSAAAQELDDLQAAAARRNAPLGTQVAATGNASVVSLVAAKAAVRPGVDVSAPAARRLAALYAGAVRPLRAGDYELHATACSPGGLAGEYWPNRAMLGPPVLARVDAGVNFTWGDASSSGGGEAAAGAAAEAMSARWSGRVSLPPAVATAAQAAFADAAANAAAAQAGAASASSASMPGWAPWWATSGAGDAAPGVLVRFFVSGGRGDQVRLFLDHRLVLDRWGHDYVGPGGAGAAGTGGLDDATAGADVLASGESGIAATGFRTPLARDAGADPVAGTRAASGSPGGLARNPLGSLAAFADPFSLSWEWGGPRSAAVMSDSFVDVVLVPGRLHSLRLDWRGAGHPHAAARLEWALPSELASPPQSPASGPSTADPGAATASTSVPSALLHRMREPALSAVYRQAGTRLSRPLEQAVLAGNASGAPVTPDPPSAAGWPSQTLLRGAVPAGCLFVERRLLGTPVPLRVRAASAAAFPSISVDPAGAADRLAAAAAAGAASPAAEAAAVAAAAAPFATNVSLPPWVLARSTAAGGPSSASTRGGGAEAWGHGLSWAIAGADALAAVSSRDEWGNDRMDAAVIDSFKVTAVSRWALEGTDAAAATSSAGGLAAVAWPVLGLRSNGSTSPPPDSAGPTGRAAEAGAVVGGEAEFDASARHHRVVWRPRRSGLHWLHLQLWTGWDSWTAVRGSPFRVVVGPAAVSPPACNASGPALLAPVAGEPNAVAVTSRDALGNPVPAASPARIGGRAWQFTVTAVPEDPAAFASSNASALLAEAAAAAAHFGVVAPVGAAQLLVPVSPHAKLAARDPARFASLLPVAAPAAVDAALDAADGALDPDHPHAAWLATHWGSVQPSVAGPTTITIASAGDGSQVAGSPFRRVEVAPGPTLPEACVLAGRALWVMTATVNNTFSLHLRDRHGNARAAWAAERAAAVMTVDPPLASPSWLPPAPPSDALDNAPRPAVLAADLLKGTPADAPGMGGLRFVPTAAGAWPVAVMVDGEHVFGSPRTITVVPGPLSAPHSVARGASLSRALAGARSFVDVEARDAANNTRAGPASVYDDWSAISVTLSLLQAGPGLEGREAGAEAAAAASVRVTRLPAPAAGDTGSAASVAASRPRGGSLSAAEAAAALGKSSDALVSGFLRCSFAATVAGNWSLRVRLGGEDIAGSPFTVQVWPNVMAAETSLVRGSGAIPETEDPASPASSGSPGVAPAAGEEHTVHILARDAWGNDVGRGGEAARIAAFRAASPVESVLRQLPASIPEASPVSAGPAAEGGPRTVLPTGSGAVQVVDVGGGNYTAHFTPLTAPPQASLLLLRLLGAPFAPAVSAWAAFGAGGIEAAAAPPGSGLVRRVYAQAGDPATLLETAAETLAAAQASAHELAPPVPAPIGASPYNETTTVPAAVSAAHSVAVGGGLHAAAVAAEASFEVELRDRFGNPRRVLSSPEEELQAVAIGPRQADGSPARIDASCSRGAAVAGFTCTYTAKRPGRYRLHVAVDAVAVAPTLGVAALESALAAAAVHGSPFMLEVSTGAPVASSSVAYGPGLSTTVAGEGAVFVVQPRDADSNNRTLPVTGAEAAAHGIVAVATLLPGPHAFIEPGIVAPGGLSVTAEARPELAPYAAGSAAAAAGGIPVPAVVRCLLPLSVAGDYVVDVTDHGAPISGSPFALRVLPAPAAAATSYSAGLGVLPPPVAKFPGSSASAGAVTLGEAAAGLPAPASLVSSSAAFVSNITVVIRDEFGNRRGGGTPDLVRNEGADAAGAAFLLPGSDDAVAVRVLGSGPRGGVRLAGVVEPFSADPGLRGLYSATVAAAEAGTLAAGTEAEVRVLVLSGKAAREAAEALGDQPAPGPRWQDDPSFGHGLVAEYFADDQAGDTAAPAAPLARRLDRLPSAGAWPVGSAAPGWSAGAGGVPALRGSGGSVRWRGWVVVPATGDYRFAVQHGAGARVLVGFRGSLAVDRWPRFSRELACGQTLLCQGVLSSVQAGDGTAAGGDAVGAAPTVQLRAGQAYELEVDWRPAPLEALRAAGVSDETAVPALLWAWRGAEGSQQPELQPVPSAALWPGAQHVAGSPARLVV